MESIELLKRLPLSQLGGSVLLDLEDKQLFIDNKGEIHEEKNDADVTLKMSEADLDAVLKGEENVISLFTMGRIAVEGDMNLAFRLKSILG